MLLRRVAEHVRLQNWTAIAIDFAIVVIGVYLGLQVQGWSSSRADRQREVQIITDMLVDLQIDRDEYATGINSTHTRVNAANASLVGAGLPPMSFESGPNGPLATYTFDATKVEEILAGQPDRLWSKVALGFFPTTSTATFDAMVGAGETKVIRDRDLVSAVIKYYSDVKIVSAQNQIVITIRADTFRIGTSHGLAPGATMPANDYFQLVASEPELSAAIRLYATYAIFHRFTIENADARAAELQERLTAYLEEMR